MKRMWRYLNNELTNERLLYGLVAFLVTSTVGLVLWVLDLSFLITEVVGGLLGFWDQAYRFVGWSLYGFVPLSLVTLAIALKSCQKPLSEIDRKLIHKIEVIAYGLGLLAMLHNLKLRIGAAANPLEVGIAFWVFCQLIDWNFLRQPQVSETSAEHIQPHGTPENHRDRVVESCQTAPEEQPTPMPANTPCVLLPKSDPTPSQLEDGLATGSISLSEITPTQL